MLRVRSLTARIIARLGARWYSGYGAARCVVHEGGHRRLRLRDGGAHDASLVDCEIGCDDG